MMIALTSRIQRFIMLYYASIEPIGAASFAISRSNDDHHAD